MVHSLSPASFSLLSLSLSLAHLLLPFHEAVESVCHVIIVPLILPSDEGKENHWKRKEKYPSPSLSFSLSLSLSLSHSPTNLNASNAQNSINRKRSFT